MKNHIKYIMACLIILLGIAVAFIFREQQEKKQEFALFVNHYYSELLTVKERAERLSAGRPSGADLARELEELEFSLTKLNQLNENGIMFVNGKIPIIKYYEYYVWILNGVESNGKKYEPFMADQKLSEAEMVLLDNLKEDTNSILKDMHSSVTGQEKPNLTLKEFKEAVNLLSEFSSFDTLVNRK